MAIMIPEAPTNFNNSEGEFEVFNALKSLDDSCYVFHSLRWLGEVNSQRRKIQGEADFAIFDPSRGLLIIEVKSGEIEYKHGYWHQTNRATRETRRMKDPEQQASDTKFEIIERLKNRLPPSNYCLLGIAVWFPSGSFDTTLLPPNLPSDIVLDKTHLLNPLEALNTVFSRWESKLHKAFNFKHQLSSLGVDKVLQSLAPTFKVISSLRDDFERNERHFIQLTQQQASVLDFLDEQDAAIINGTAGTGKTVLALEKARRLSESGESVLFLCWNRMLRDFLKISHRMQGVDFFTFSQIAFIKSAQKGGFNSNFESNISQFIEYLSDPRKTWEYKHLIIDEGQDLQDEWIEHLLARTEGCRYIFYDNLQILEHRNNIPSWIINSECKVTLKRNCRNTLEVAKTAFSFIDSTFRQSIEFPIIKWQATTLHNSDKSSVDLQVCLTIKDYYDQGIRPDEIVVLDVFGDHTQRLRSILGICKAQRIYFSGELINHVPSCTSPRKYKGLESKVVILILDMGYFVQPGNARINFIRNELYVACTRSTNELHVVFLELSILSLLHGSKPLFGENLLNSHYENSYGEWEINDGGAKIFQGIAQKLCGQWDKASSLVLQDI